jgi:hypothetical protein
MCFLYLLLRRGARDEDVTMNKHSSAHLFLFSFLVTQQPAAASQASTELCLLHLACSASILETSPSLTRHPLRLSFLLDLNH